MTTIRPELEAILLKFADAWERGEHKGQKIDFMFSQALGRHGVRLTHPGLARDGGQNERVSLPDLEELQDFGMIAITETGSGRGRFRLTGDGHQHAHRARFEEVAVPIALDWKQDVNPVLAAVYKAMTKSGSPRGANQASINAELAREPGDATTDRVLYELERTDFIEAGAPIQQSLGPAIARLTEKGLQRVAGWPGAESSELADRLVWALEQRIQQTDDEEERGRLRNLRDDALGIGRDVLTDVLSKIATGQV